MKDMKPFFVMPGQAIIDLREELELIEGEEAGETLQRYGFRAGIGLIKSLGISASDFEHFAEVLPQLWAETGLSRMVEEHITDKDITIAFEESIEAAHGRNCDFMRGYLCGIVSALLKRRYTAVEKECTSSGKASCVHVLSPAKEIMQPSVRESAKTTMKYDLELGYSYLIESEDPSIAYDIFTDQMTHGRPGMCIVRDYPEKLRARYDLGDCTILWLSYDRDINYAREPTNIPLIYSEIKNFLDSAESGVVLLSGIEYMVSQSTFTKVLKLIQLLNENVAVRDSLLLVPVSPQALTQRDVKMLERELRVFDTKQQ
jgi:predicted hydrocarbon binding protein